MTTDPPWSLAARVVLPVDHDEDVLPLYVEYGLSLIHLSDPTRPY